MTSHVRRCWSGFGAWKFHASQIYVVVGLAMVPMIVAALAQSVGRPLRVALYASVGEELIAFGTALPLIDSSLPARPALLTVAREAVKSL